MFLRKQSKLVSLLLAVALGSTMMLSGCGSKPAASSNPGTPASTPGTSTPASTAAPEGQSGEKVLRVARSWEKTSMDPATWGTHVDIAFGKDVFETLLRYDDKLEASPLLAESWEVSADELTYTFKLRQGVQFHHDYGEMKASDVAFSINRLSDPEVKAASNGPALGTDNLASVTAVDDYTLQVVLKEIDTNFLYKLCESYVYVISEKAVTELTIDGFAKNPVGTGPFAFDKGTAGEKLECVKNEKYWGEPAKLDRIIYYTITDPATYFNAFESHEVDMISVSDANKVIEYKGATDKYNITFTPSRYYSNFGFNCKEGPFADVRVRQAAVYAIDREALINDYYQGLSFGPTDFINEGAKYSVPDIFHPTYDPEKAKSLLAEAGYPNGFDSVIYCPNDQISMGPTTIAQSYLSAVGIRAELQAVDFGIFIETVKAGTAPMWFLADGPEVIPDTWLYRWTSMKSPGSNFSCFENKEYDAAVTAGMDAHDPAERAKFFGQAQKILADQVPYYPLEGSGGYMCAYKNITGYQPYADGTFSYHTVDIQ